ncbi:MAG: hypothetical protein RL160_1898 [Bacteroidota bacterium]|jgi:hypothetical protein
MSAPLWRSIQKKLLKRLQLSIMKGIARLLLLLLTPTVIQLQAQDLKSWDARLGFKIGYTIGGRMRYGFDAEFLRNKSSERTTSQAWGLGISKYWCGIRYGYRKDIHRLHSIYLLRQEGTLTLKAGPGFVRNPWGYGNNVYCRTGGLFLSAEGWKKEYKPLVAGADLFMYMRSTWRWYNAPYISVYSGAKTSLR